jgi:hypothetical protein
MSATVSLDFTKEQEDLFHCTAISNEFEIRFGNSEQRRVKSGSSSVSTSSHLEYSYSNGISKNAWDSLVSKLSSNPIYTLSTEQYTNVNYESSEIRARKTNSGSISYITKESIRKNDVLFNGLTIRISESTETVIPSKTIDEKTYNLRAALTRQITRKSFSTIVNHSTKKNGEIVSLQTKISIDCSTVISKDNKGEHTTWEVEMEVVFPTKQVSYYHVLQPFLNEIVLGLYGNKLPLSNVYFFQRDKLQDFLSSIEKQLQLSFSNLSSIRGLVYNLKSTHINQLENYAMTNKLDGERKMVIILAANEDSPGWIIIMNSGGVDTSLLSDSIFLIQHNNQEVDMMMVDVEFYQSVYYIFDVLYVKKQMIHYTSKISHEKRMNAINEIQLSLPITLKKKIFLYGSLDENISEIQKQYSSAHVYFSENDGIIFTPKNASYAETHEDKPHLKFKFSSKLSVDFLCKTKSNDPADSTFTYSYDLYSGPSKRNANQPLQLYQLHSLLPIEDNKVIECIGYNGHWLMLRYRPDKKYGNSEFVINDVISDIIKPLSILELFSDISISNKRYVNQLQHLNQTYLYDLFYSHLLSISYQTIPQYVLQILFMLFEIPDKDEVPFKQMITKTIKTFSDKMDHVIMDEICKQFLLHPISYYTQKELEMFYNVYEMLFPSQSLKTSKIIFDIRSNSLLNEREKCLIHRHIHSSDDDETSTETTESLPHPSFDIRLHKFSDKVVVPRYQVTKKEFDIYFMYRQFDVVPASEYSVLKPWHVLQVKDILQKWFPFPYHVKNIVDTTAHIGTDSIHLSSVFPIAEITSFEIEPDAYVALQKNIHTFHKQKTIKAIHKDASLWLPTTKIDMIYIDPPWGGHGYDKYPLLDLFLQKEGRDRDGSKNINYIIHKWMNTGNVSNIILKAPKNFNSSYLKQHYYVQTEIVYDKRSHPSDKIEYYLFHITPKLKVLQKPYSKVTVWSLPYFYNSYDTMFLNTEAVLVLQPKFSDRLFLATTVVQQYIFSPQSYSRPMIINIEEVRLAAKEKGFVEYKTITSVTNDTYLLFVNSKVNVANANTNLNLKKEKFLGVISQKIQEESDNIKEMRKYHNKEKKSIIQKYARKKRVLDLGIGFGGDLQKYQESEITRLIGVEPSETNLVECQHRLDTTYLTLKPNTLIVQAKGEEWDKIRPFVSPERMQIVSSFFSLTFLFESREKLGSFLHTVNESLEEGGYFIGTMMSGEKTYQLLKDTKKGNILSKPFNDLIQLDKQYDNSETATGELIPSFGMKVHITMPEDTIVKSQDEYLAFFSLLRQECEMMGLQLVHMYHFMPPAMLQAHEIAFSSLNIGFVFQKLPRVFSHAILPCHQDETFQFINLYKDDQQLVRTGIQSDHTFIRSYLYNTEQVYRSDVTKRQKLVDAMKSQFQYGLEISSLPLFMKEKNINCYVIDSITRRPIVIDGYQVGRAKSIIMVYHSSTNSFEPIGFNVNGKAKREFGPLDPHIVCIHRAMMK